MILLCKPVPVGWLFLGLFFYILIGIVVVSAAITLIAYVFNLCFNSKQASFSAGQTFKISFYILGGFFLFFILLGSFLSLLTSSVN